MNEEEAYRLKCEEIKFPQSWAITLIPATTGAALRFLVRDIVTNNKVSVYLDNDCSLGAVQDLENKPIPYWEVYRTAGKGRRDPARCLFSEGNTRLLEVIFTELNGEGEIYD
jgi:hypothetical protein